MTTRLLARLILLAGLVTGTMAVAAEPTKEQSTASKRSILLEGAFGKAEFDVQTPAMTGLYLRGPDGRLSPQSLLSKQGVTSYYVPCMDLRRCAEVPWARDACTYVVGEDGKRYESRIAVPDKAETTREGGRTFLRLTGVKLCDAPGREPVATENWVLSTPGDGQELVWKIERRWAKGFSAVMSGSPGLFFGFHPQHLSNAVTSTLWYDPARLATQPAKLYNLFPGGESYDFVFPQCVTVQDRDTWGIYKLWTAWHAPADLRLQVEGGHLYRRGHLALLSEAGAVTSPEAVQERRAGQIEQITLRIGAADKRTTGYQLNVSIPDREVEQSLTEFYGSLFNGGAIADQKRLFVGNSSDSYLCAVNAMTHGNALAAGVLAPGKLSARHYDAASAMRGYLDHILATVDETGRFDFGYDWRGTCYDLRLNVLIGTGAYWLHTGDLDLVRRRLPALERLLLHFVAHRDENGLFRMNEVYHWYYDALPTSGLNTYYNALFYRAALTLAEMEEALGRGEKAREYRTLAHGIKAGFNKVLWREDAPGGPRYVDWIDPQGREWMQFTDLCQWIPLAVGIAPAERARKVIATADTRIKELEKSRGYPGFATLSALWPVGWPQNPNEETFGTYMSGGCLLANTYWEIVARARSGDPDGAWRRLQRFAGHASKTSWSGNNATNIRCEFPGSGGDGEAYLSDMVVVPAALVDGFLGMQRTAKDFSLTPALPAGWSQMSAEIQFQGRRYRVTAEANGKWHKDSVISQSEPTPRPKPPT